MSFPITCTACHKTFTISDEIYEKKVAGRVVTIKCKSCGHGIRVDGSKSGAAQPSTPPAAPAQSAGAAPVEPLWAVDYPDGQDREFTTPEVIVELQRGAINGQTLVWRDGMAEWLEIAQVAELAPELAKVEATKKAEAEAKAKAEAEAKAKAEAEARAKAQAEARAKGPAAPVHTPRAPMPTVSGLGGTPGAGAKPKAGVGSSPELKPKSSPLGSGSDLKPRAPLGSGPDLKPRAPLGSGPDLKPRAPLGSAPDLKPRAPLSSSPEIRQKTEPLGSSPEITPRAPRASSTEITPRVPTTAWTEVTPRVPAAAPQPIGKAPPAAPPPAVALTPPESLPVTVPNPVPVPAPAAAVAAPTPPPAPAPAVRPLPAEAFTPPLPASVAQAVSKPVPALASAPSFPMSTSPAPTFGTMPAVVADHATVEWPEAKKKTPLVILGLVAAALVAGGVAFALSGKDELPPPTPITAAPPMATGTPTTAPTATTAPTSQPGAETATGSDPVVATPGAGFAELFAAGARKAESKGASVAPTSRFDPAATKAPLAQAATDAQACKQSGGPSGKVTVMVTFDPNGKASGATINDAPFAGTPTASCIAAAMKRATIPPFSGLPGTVSKTFTLL